MKRIWCALFGHTDTVVAWGRIRAYPGDRLTREVAEVCERCRQVVGTATLIQSGERWTA
jgi:O-acetyl-ADP-ribose deacetylase (regulator of RNase III)